MQLNTLITGDTYEKLKTLDDTSIDSIVTDSPYGLGKEPDPVEVMKYWIEKGYYEVKDKQGGFMGKAWDAFVPQPIVWKECYRVLKPGGYILSFFGSRTIDWGTMSLRFAGFEIRDTIEYFFDEAEAGQDFVNSLTKEHQEMLFRLTDATGIHGVSWLQSQGLPKSLDLCKATGDKKFSGYGTGMKPAHENIVMCRKLISETTVAKNVLKWGTGGINIDACRIEKAGRFPANVILECTCDEVIEHGEANKPYEYKDNEYQVEGFIHNIKPNSPSNYNDHKHNMIHTNPNCPCYQLDKQSGKLKSGINCTRTKPGTGYHGNMQKAGEVQKTYGDIGFASRFFY
jgi:hypothetical protein